jgi:4-hydroxy-tetrahydrodipicolinate synthase
LIGPEELIPQAVAAGAHGAICGGANLIPQLYVQFYNAAKECNQDEIDRLDKIVKHMVFPVIYENGGLNKMIAGLKYAMEKRGLCCSRVASPLQPPSTKHCKAIDLIHFQTVLWSC